MHAAITAALGFLVAVLWFDLMSVVSLIGSGLAIMLALTRVVPSAVRLGARLDPPSARSNLARGILRDHVVFLALIAAVLVVQLAAG